jgi:hypothetical protein
MAGRRKPEGTDYARVLGRVFEKHRPSADATEFRFDRTALSDGAKAVGVELPKNIGDVLYSLRYRTDPPPEIARAEPAGMEWVIFGAGKSKYRFVLVKKVRIGPTEALKPIKIPDATPEIIRKYANSDEQALLAIIRYNRLLDLFLGLVTYPLQSHLRTFVPDVGQIEIDELYVGVNRRGAHFVIPVQAKTKKDRIGIVQVWQDTQLCRSDNVYRHLITRPIGAQLHQDRKTISLFELQVDGYELSQIDEKKYVLVPQAEISDSDRAEYRSQSETKD